MESFFKWLNNNQSPKDSSENTEFEEYKRIWDTAGNRLPMDVPDKAMEWQKIQQALDKKESTRRIVPLVFLSKIAASLLLLIASGVLIYMLVLKADVYQSKSNSMLVQLADGSEVLLNKNSELVVKSMFNRSSRNVLLSGEAYFKVSKAKHPFIIKTQVAQIKVVGTEFNVKARPQKVELAVNEGIVDFSNINDTDNKVRVKKGFLSNCMVNSVPENPKQLKFDDYPGWMHGKIYFQDNTVAEICRDLELCFDMKIEISTDSVKGKIISGTLDSSNPNEIMQILCSLIQQDYKMEHDKYIIY